MSKRWDRQLFERLATLLPTEMALGRVAGVTLKEKFGRNPQINTTTDPEDVWNGGGLYTGQPVGGNAEGIELFSGNDLDIMDIQLIGLDENWATQEVTKTLEGTTSIFTTELWRRMFRMRILEPEATTGFNVGQITARHTTTTTNVFAVMPIGTNRTSIGAFTIPLGYTGISLDYIATAARGTDKGFAAMRLLVRELGMAYEARDFVDPIVGAGGEHRDLGALVLPEKTDIVMRVDEVSSSSTAVTVRFKYLLIDNAVYGL